MKTCITLDVFDELGASLGEKRFYTMQNTTANIGKWIAQYRIKNPSLHLGMLNSGRVDFQNQKLVYIKYYVGDESHALTLTLTNLIPCAVFFAIRHCIKATWINDRDQFLAPNKKWEKDSEFQNDCLAFMLFHTQNKITAKEGINHFIPFSEREIHAQEAFASHFMRDFINGKIKQDSTKQTTKPSLASKGKQSVPAKPSRSRAKEAIHQNQASLFHSEPDTRFIPTKPLDFSKEAKEVLEAGKELFKHYHTQAKDLKNYEPNASLYDIKAHFQGFSDTGKNKMKMNPPQRAKDEAYKERLSTLNSALKNLAKKIESKVYNYGFLLP